MKKSTDIKTKEPSTIYKYCSGCGEQFPVCYCEHEDKDWIKSQETNAELLMNPTIKVEDIKERLENEEWREQIIFKNKDK